MSKDTSPREPWTYIKDRPLEFWSLVNVPWPAPFIKGTCRWCRGAAYSPRATWCAKWDRCMKAVYEWWWQAEPVRRALFNRDGFRCAACPFVAPLIDVAGRMVHDMRTLHADHVVALAAGGAHSWTNLQTLCASCNLRKGAKAEWQPVLAGVVA